MKRNKFISLLPAALFAAAGLDAAEIGKGRKMLTVYYSWSGNTRHIEEFVNEYIPFEPLLKEFKELVNSMDKKERKNFFKMLKDV